MGLQPLDLTYIAFDHTDPISAWAAYTSLFPLVLLVIIGSFVLARRELETIFCLSGLLVNEALNYVLKHTLKQPRPATALNHGYGMPSSHTQLMFFWAVYVLTWMRRRHYRYSDDHSAGFGPTDASVTCATKWYKPAGAAACVVSAIGVGVSRVVLGVHSIEQVIAGAVTGTAFGLVWHYAVGGGDVAADSPARGGAWWRWSGVRSYYRRIAQWRLSQYFLLRDSTRVPNVMVAEYEQHNLRLARKPQAQSQSQSQSARSGGTASAFD